MFYPYDIKFYAILNVLCFQAKVSWSRCFRGERLQLASLHVSGRASKCLGYGVTWSIGLQERRNYSRVDKEQKLVNLYFLYQQ